MNKEVHYEGWLIKSPPTKRIWRARWRRRWFTLKQGEIPEQFCLEYYTDRNCRKLKGVIDLDQCEQVDCGLRLENRKQKFQFMFDIKTPRRTYYLAADSEADMRDWVNCICQVCHLHDTKQSNELEDGNQTQTTTSTALTALSSSSSNNNTNNTTTTSLNLTDNPGGSISRQSFNSSDILRRHPVTAIQQQPQSSAAALPAAAAAISHQTDESSGYVNTEYSNRETMLSDARLQGQQVTKATVAATVAATNAATNAAIGPSTTPNSQPLTAPQSTTALYLNSSIFNIQETAARLAINSNGVVRKIPNTLVLNNSPLADSQQNSVQASPALSTASGPYIPISECFSGSPKFLPEGNNTPRTPLNNLDAKFYDTPRSHNNIGLNHLTNDQSSSPKISNCSGLQQHTPSKSRSGRSDSDSESVFTDDDEWTHPIPLRENIDRHTRPSDSSVENDSCVFTYSQRFSKLPDDLDKDQQQITENTAESVAMNPLKKLGKAFKNRNNLILDIEENESSPRDMSQLSDTDNTSPAIGPGDAKSVVEESYDIPRSHNLPYCNMGQLMEKVGQSPETNPIAASTPNLMLDSANNATSSSPNTCTLPRPHCYTNAAPTKVEGNVFSYDFMEQGDLPPVNRKLKPKVSLEDKPPEEVAAKPPVNLSKLKQSPINVSVDGLTNKLITSSIQTPSPSNKSIGAATPTSLSSPKTTTTTTITKASTTVFTTSDNLPMTPPSVDRKSKPNAYKFGNSATIGPSSRRSTGAPLSMVLSHENEGGYIMQTRTLPRHPRPNYTMAVGGANTPAIHTAGSNQRLQLSAAAVQMGQTPLFSLLLLPKNEHKLQYFDLDVANPPQPIHRQSMSVGNLNAPAGVGMVAGRYALSADPSARAPVKSSIVYNSVDFVKTEAFKRVREEREKETEIITALTK